MLVTGYETIDNTVHYYDETDATKRPLELSFAPRERG